MSLGLSGWFNYRGTSQAETYFDRGLEAPDEPPQATDAIAYRSVTELRMCLAVLAVLLSFSGSISRSFRFRAI